MQSRKEKAKSSCVLIQPDKGISANTSELEHSLSKFPKY
jgi:hypothetical protein